MFLVVKTFLRKSNPEKIILYRCNIGREPFQGSMQKVLREILGNFFGEFYKFFGEFIRIISIHYYDDLLHINNLF